MLVAATSPDGGIQASINRAAEIEVTFTGSAYRRYNEETMRHQLERLAVLAWVAYDRALTEEHRRTLGYATAEYAEHERRPKDERRQRYDADLAAVEATGLSSGGSLRIRARGMLHWQVHIEPGTLRRLNQVDFLNELNSALHALFVDRELKITVIKARYYDLGIPRAWRDLLIDPGPTV